MEIFIRSTIVNPHIRILRKRLLPTRGTIVTGVGQKLTANQTVARASLGIKFQVLPLSDMLNLSPADVKNLLTLTPGSRITQGMPLLEQKRALGRGTTFNAPYDGEFHGVKQGRLIIKQTGEIFELRALLPGRVVKIYPERGVLLETYGALIQGIWSTADEVMGKIKLLTFSPDGFIFPEQLNADLSGMILAIGHIDQAHILEKASDTGVRAIITGTMPSHLFPIARSCGMPIFVTDGVGAYGFSAPTFSALQEAEGHMATLFPAGLESSRPEIIVPVEQKTTRAPASATEPLAIGQQVRLLRRPYTNQIAEITHVYTRAQWTEIGYRAYGADVRLKTNQVVFVPFTNMEAII